MEYILSALVLGLSAGFSPGPLMTLVILHSFQYGKREGIYVALAPLITDTPIVLISLFVLARLTEFGFLMGCLSLFGGVYLGYLGYKSVRITGIDLNSEHANPQSFRKGIIANFLSPNPYMFWLSIGAPLTIDAYRITPFYAIGFLSAFYVCLVGGKILTAVVVGYSRHFLKSSLYIYVNRILGVLLWFYAAVFLRDAWKAFFL